MTTPVHQPWHNCAIYFARTGADVFVRMRTSEAVYGAVSMQLASCAGHPMRPNVHISLLV